MEKKRQKIWTAIGVGIAIALLLYWLTLAIWIDDGYRSPYASSRRRNIKLLKYTKIAPDKNFLQYKCVLLSKPGKKRLSLGKKKRNVASVEPKSPVWKS